MKGLRRHLEAKLDEEIRKAVDRIGADPDTDIEENLRRTETYSKLLTAIRPNLLREWVWWFVAVCCIFFVGLLWTLRIGETKITLVIKSEAVALELAESSSWGGELSLDMNPDRIETLTVLNAPALGIDIKSKSGSAWIQVNAKKILLTQLNIERNGILELSQSSGRSLTIFAKATELNGRLEVMGPAALSVGEETAGTSIDKRLNLTIPETIDFHASGVGTVPIRFRSRSGAFWILQNLSVKSMTFAKEISREPGEFSAVSTIMEGALTLYDAGKKTVTLHEGDRLLLEGVEGRVVKLRGGKGINVIFEGAVKKIKIGPKGFEHDHMPTYLIYLYYNQPLALLWSAVVSLWGILWSIRRTIFA